MLSAVGSTAKPSRMPVYFVSHGGGPWPWIPEMARDFAKTAEEFAKIPATLPQKPKAVLVITGHWEEPQFTVSTSERPPMEYDYYGFPEHTYKIQYPAPGSAPLAHRVREVLREAGIPTEEDSKRGFDHGTFVPLSLMYPDADVPIVLLSLKSDYDPTEHIRVGEALERLRDEGILIVGSGLTYHNMRGFRQPGSMPVSQAFEGYLNNAITDPDPASRNGKLECWETGPSARAAHPREDHLLPLMVVAGAAGDDPGKRLFVDNVMGVAMASYRFG